ncbi:MAG: molecular chaperone DnaJ, partial [Bacteroidota bacterium]
GDAATQTPPRGLDPRLVAFFRSCLLPNPARRPQDAWALFGEFRDLLQTLYGPPRFRPFAMPSNPA